jgi:hypothetical protein
MLLDLNPDVVVILERPTQAQLAWGLRERTHLAVDLQQLRSDLHHFYDFSDKTVLFVGAGGSQLFDIRVATRTVVAIDQDADTLKDLKASVAALDPPAPVEVIASSFTEIASCVDVIYFEFCLHEMEHPYETLNFARKLSPDIVVFDHLPGSVWSFYAAEEKKVRLCMEAMERFGIRRHATFGIEQRFRGHAELQGKLARQGSVANGRARHFARASDIVIPMSYQLALL